MLKISFFSSYSISHYAIATHAIFSSRQKLPVTICRIAKDWMSWRSIQPKYHTQREIYPESWKIKWCEFQTSFFQHNLWCRIAWHFIYFLMIHMDYLNPRISVLYIVGCQFDYFYSILESVAYCRALWYCRYLKQFVTLCYSTDILACMPRSQNK